MRKKCAYRAHRVQLHVFAEHKKGLWMGGSCGFLALSKAHGKLGGSSPFRSMKPTVVIRIEVLYNSYKIGNLRK